MPVHMRPIVKALHKKVEKRNKMDFDALVDYFKGVKCFREIHISYHDMVRLTNCVTLRFVPQHDVVYRIGDFGQSFYVQLSGISQLFIRNPEYKALRHRKLELINELEKEKERL